MQLEYLSTIQLLFLVSDYVTVAIGLAISYLAYRGYRDHRSKPMLFVALGFVLVMGVPGLLGGLFFLLPVGRTTIGAVTQVSEIAGMCSILYGLWMDPE